jgi:hypothetical protein
MRNSIKIAFVLIILSFSISACQTNWQIVITKDGEKAGQFTSEDFSFYLEKLDEGTRTVPLGQMLYINGFTLINDITLVDHDDVKSTFIWDEIALETQLMENGQVLVGDKEYSPTTIDVKESPLVSEIEYNITDISPTIASVLGLPTLPQASGEVLMEGKAKNGAMILLDGFQYQKMQSMIETSELPFLASVHEEIHMGLTVYPPVTVAASAALLTGSLPQINGVYGHGFRSTDLTTLFDLAAHEGKSIVAVEGASLPFNLRNAETTISGDRDGDGFSDDNVFDNSLEVIQSGMPDLLYIHFHEIDDMGHSYGPESEEYQSAAVRVDGYLSQIYEALPPDTFIAIFTDHGMHPEEKGGNHSNLIASDLIIPIIFLEK